MRLRPASSHPDGTKRRAGSNPSPAGEGRGPGREPRPPHLLGSTSAKGANNTSPGVASGSLDTAAQRTPHPTDAAIPITERSKRRSPRTTACEVRCLSSPHEVSVSRRHAWLQAQKRRMREHRECAHHCAQSAPPRERGFESSLSGYVPPQHHRDARRSERGLPADPCAPAA